MLIQILKRKMCSFIIPMINYVDMYCVVIVAIWTSMAITGHEQDNRAVTQYILLIRIDVVMTNHI